MLSLGGVVGPSGWWSVFIMCVWGSWHDGALGHWHGNSLAITPAAPRSDWCSYMGHRRLRRSHRYGWKVGFCSSRLFFFPPLWVSWRKGRKEAQHVLRPRPMFSLYVSCSFFLSFFLSFLLSFSPSFFLLPSSPLLSLIPLCALWSVSKLPFCLSGSNTFFLFLLISSPPPRKLSECTSGIPFFLF